MTTTTTFIPTWSEYRRLHASPVIITRDGRMFAYPADWDFVWHRPRHGARPIVYVDRRPVVPSARTNGGGTRKGSGHRKKR